MILEGCDRIRLSIHEKDNTDQLEVQQRQSHLYRETLGSVDRDFNVVHRVKVETVRRC
jgi:hypothetical protein